MPRLIAEHFRRDGKAKQSFNSYAEAQAFLYKHKSATRLKTYKCSFCGKYHNGTP